MLVMPAVRILDNVQLEANHYFIKIKEIDAGHGIVYAGQYMAMDPMGGSVNLPGHNVLEPTFGLPATWIDGALQDEAQLRGYTVVDAATVISTHLTEVLKSHMPELLSFAETQKLLDELPREAVEVEGSSAMQRQRMATAPSVFAHGPISAGRPRIMEAKLSEKGAWEVQARPARKDAMTVGTRVFHQKFGYGRVVAAEDNKLDVEFDKAGRKRVLDTFVEKA